MSIFDDIRGIANGITTLANSLEVAANTPGIIPSVWPNGMDCLSGTPPTLPVMIPGEQDISYYQKKCYSFDRMHHNAPTGSVVCIGDSITEAMAVNSISPYALNFGISGDTLRGVLNRINSQGSQNILHRSSAGILLIGINDICFEGTNAFGNCSFMWDKLSGWMTGKWVIVLTLPINETMFSGTTNAQIDAINTYVKNKFINRAGISIVEAKSVLAPAEQLLPAYTVDGCHLSGAGYNVLRPLIKTALNNLIGSA